MDKITEIRHNEIPKTNPSPPPPKKNNATTAIIKLHFNEFRNLTSRMARSASDAFGRRLMRLRPRPGLVPPSLALPDLPPDPLLPFGDE